MPLLVVLAASIMAAMWLWIAARRRRRQPEPALAVAPPAPFGGLRPPVVPAAAVAAAASKPVKEAKTKTPKPPKPPKGRPADPVMPMVPAVTAAVATSAAAMPAAPSAALDEPFGEALMPRWRRPSLKTARYSTPKIAPMPAPAMTFARTSSSDLERRVVRYDLVPLNDIPDEIRGTSVGQLQANDEVELIERRGAWVKVRTPVGAEGWIHRTTLQAVDETPEPGTARPTPGPIAEPSSPAIIQPPPKPAPLPEQESIEADAAVGAFAAAAARAARERELQQELQKSSAAAPAKVSPKPPAPAPSVASDAAAATASKSAASTKAEPDANSPAQSAVQPKTRRRTTAKPPLIN